jgi:FKBP-type peptidyl-prolyl cis-trans isomerase FklB
MKIKILLPLFFAFAIMLSSCGEKIDTNAKLETRMDSLSYSLGVNVAGSLQASYLEEINYNAFFKGMTASFDDLEVEISEQEAHEIIKAYFSIRRIQRVAENLKEGQSFLLNNKEKDGIITAQGGLQYEIIQEGTGISPTANDTVIVHYTGTLIDGRVLDSSIEKAEPFKTPLNGVITGWKVGLPLMKEGAKYKFYIPTELGYGVNVRPGSILEPNMALIYEIELLEVIKGVDGPTTPMGVN